MQMCTWQFPLPCSFHADPYITVKYIQPASSVDSAHLDSCLASALGSQAGDRLSGSIEDFQEGVSPHSLPQVGHHFCRQLLHLHRGIYTVKLCQSRHFCTGGPLPLPPAASPAHMHQSDDRNCRWVIPLKRPSPPAHMHQCVGQSDSLQGEVVQGLHQGIRYAHTQCSARETGLPPREGSQCRTMCLMMRWPAGLHKVAVMLAFSRRHDNMLQTPCCMSCYQTHNAQHMYVYAATGWLLRTLMIYWSCQNQSMPRTEELQRCLCMRPAKAALLMPTWKPKWLEPPPCCPCTEEGLHQGFIPGHEFNCRQSGTSLMLPPVPSRHRPSQSHQLPSPLRCRLSLPQ